MKTNQPQETPFEGLTRSLFMESINNLLTTRKQLTVNSKLSVVNSQLTSKLLTDKEIDFCLKETSDLINPEFEAWYRLRLYKLGVSEYMERAERARKYGKSPVRYFSSILRR